MGLELDKLQTNDDVTIIYNNTTGVLIDFYDLPDFKKKLLNEFAVTEEEIKKYFTFNELEDFFQDNNIEYEEEELKAITYN